MKYRKGEELFTISEMINLYKKERPKLNFKPSEKFEYSNTGYVLLSEIVARVSNQTFSEFMWENIFSVLGMKDTQVFNLISEGAPSNRVYVFLANATP